MAINDSEEVKNCHLRSRECEFYLLLINLRSFCAYLRITISCIAFRKIADLVMIIQPCVSLTM